jgi:hypothetical protein
MGKGAKGWRGFKYGDLQIWCYKGVVEMIGIYFVSGFRPILPKELGFEIPFDCHITLEELKNFLAQRHITWRHDNRLKGCTGLFIGDRTVAAFTEDDELECIIATGTR